MTPIENVLSKIEGLKPSGDSGRQWVGCCPAHGDQRQSLGVAVADNGNVLVKCYAGCDFKDICAAVGLESRDLFPIPDDGKGITIGRLAYEKRLEINWLKLCGVRQIQGRNAVEIPYLDEDGKELFVRTRDSKRAKDGTKQPPGVKLRPYGLWKLKEFLGDGKTTLFIVEGESDCWSLWLHGIPALGIPGASATRVLEASNLTGFSRVVIWSEPDAGGDGFATKMFTRLTEVGYAGEVRVHKATKDAKDPSDIAAHLRDDFPAAMQAVVDNAAVANVGTVGQPPASPAGPAGVPPLVAAAGFGGSPYPWGQFPFTDQGNAARLIHLNGQDLLYVPPWDRWYVWDGVRWKYDETLRVASLAMKALQGIWWETQVAPSRTAADAAERWWINSQSSARHSSCVSLARMMVPTDYRTFDAHHDLFVAANGTVDLLTGELQPSDRDDRITMGSPVPYDPAAECPVWERTIEQIFTADPDDPAMPPDRDLVEFFQRLTGVFLTGRTPKILPIFNGEGNNGKSLVINTIQKVLGGDYAMSVSPTILMETPTERHPTELADFYGKRAVFTQETRQGATLNASLVKKLTGGDPIRARRMREDNWEFFPTHTLVISTNHRPRVPADDAAIWDRIALVPFRVKFWKPSQDKPAGGPDHLRIDETLWSKLRAEYPGILAWMVRGARAYLEGDLIRPRAVTAETGSYRVDEDVIGQFLDEHTTKLKGHRVMKMTLYKLYNEWANDAGLRPMSAKKFTEVLRVRGIEEVRLESGRFWVDMDIRQSAGSMADLDRDFS